jgi:putative DNA methylase
VPCPNTAGGTHELPLVRQTWLARKKGRYVALRPRVDREARNLRWDVVEGGDASDFDFDPAGFSSRGRASCLICGAAVDTSYIKAQGLAGMMGIAPLAAVLIKPGGRGRSYVAAGTYPDPSLEECEAVLASLNVGVPEEPICTFMDAGFRVAPYGLTRFRDLFTWVQVHWRELRGCRDDAEGVA